jgi:hypothetical protein
MDLVAVLEDSPLPLSWKGETLLELTTKFDAARSQRLAGADAQVEDLYVEVLEGYTHILGATHKDTIHVALTLATFYAEEDQMQEANGIIQETLRDHLERWGIKHKQTQQHLLDVVGILNGWNRPNEAFALLSRAKELVDIAERRTTNSDARPRSKKTATSSKAAETDRLLDIAHTIRVVGGPENVAYGVNMARNHASANAEGVEALLLSILDHCEKHPMGLEIQHLKARAELLRWYKKNDTVLGHISSFVRAKEVFGILWSSFQWDYERSDSLDMMEASLELSSAMLHANFDNLAEDIFGIVSDQARTLFARDMERAIWVDITIGLVYQKYRSWAVSSRWFQQALASAIFKYDDDDGIVKALHNAMRRHHFTYLTDDGKPFRTIFGVCGLVIRPNRLHLE